MLINRNQLEAELCRRSFYDFFLRFWSVISPEKLVPNWHIKVICDELQTVAERVFRREPKLYDLIINVPPGSTKSSICSIAYPAWCWIRDPSLRLICGSFGYDLSLELSQGTRQVIDSEKFKELFPEIILTENGKEIIRNSKGGYRRAASVGSAPTGKHAHIHVFDDLIDAKAALSEVSLKDARTWVMQVMPSRMVNLALTPVILLMQRLAIGDPTDVMFEREKAGGTPIRFFCLPAELSKYVRPRAMRQNYTDGLLDPLRLSRPILANKRAEMGQHAYIGQYGQEPTLPSGGMFRVDMFKIADKVEGQLVRVVRYWDKAGTEKGGAYTVGVKMGVDRTGHFWVLDVVRGQWEAAERERVIARTAIADRREHGSRIRVGVEREPGSGGKESAQNTVRSSLLGQAAMADKPVGNKSARADVYATQVNDGNVTLLRAYWNDEYKRELSLFWYGPYKDQVDSSSGAFKLLLNRVAVGGLDALKKSQYLRQRVA